MLTLFKIDHTASTFDSVVDCFEVKPYHETVHVCLRCIFHLVYYIASFTFCVFQICAHALLCPDGKAIFMPYIMLQSNTMSALATLFRQCASFFLILWEMQTKSVQTFRTN